MDQTIDFSNIAGVGSSTVLEVTPSASVVDATGNQVYTREPIKVALNGGIGSVTLRPTDDTGLYPQDFTYAVTGRFGKWRLSTHIAPVVADGATVEFSDIVPVSASGGVLITKGEQGDVGPAGGGTHTTRYRYQGCGATIANVSNGVGV